MTNRELFRHMALVSVIATIGIGVFGFVMALLDGGSLNQAVRAGEVLTAAGAVGAVGGCLVIWTFDR